MKKTRTYILIMTLALVIIFLWYAYSLFRFDGFYQPAYVIGLSKSYEYYQSHIGSKLEQHGKEYNVKDLDVSSWNTYRDSDTGFEFGYPQGFSAALIAQDKHRKSIRLSGSDDDHKKCMINIESNGWKIGQHGLPSQRRMIEFNIENGKNERLWFIRDQYGGSVGVESTRFQQETDSEIRYTGTTFIQKKTGIFLHLVDYGNSCDETTIKGILATSRFID